MPSPNSSTCELKVSVAYKESAFKNVVIPFIESSKAGKNNPRCEESGKWLVTLVGGGDWEGMRRGVSRYP